jgi:transglutaminase-like putative cysteine protease
MASSPLASPPEEEREKTTSQAWVAGRMIMNREQRKAWCQVKSRVLVRVKRGKKRQRDCRTPGRFRAMGARRESTRFWSGAVLLPLSRKPVGLKSLIAALACVLLFTTKSFAQPNTMQKAGQMELKGRFKEAAEMLQAGLKNGPSIEEKKKLEFELDRLERIRKDFPYTKEELFSELNGAVKNLTAAEYESWVKEGRFDGREIDGQRRFMSSSVSNLYWRYPELNPRRTPQKETARLDQAHYEAVAEIRKAALAEKKPYVLPKRFHVTMKVTAKASAAPADETIRAWLPIPRAYPFQTEIALVSATPEAKRIDPPDSPIRCAYFEQTARKGETEFKLEYEYTKHGVYFAVDPKDVRACPDDPALKPFIQEAPHVVFTPEIRALSKQIAGDETNPYLKAKKFYDWIADQIKYSYAIEYSTIRNISDYCRTKGYGDCGQEALLFITLCRLNGIPARWQSGWDTFPNSTTIHDWSEIYVAPYGWIPVDPYMGIYAMRYATTLNSEQKKEVRDFFFGGQDWYRMAANSDHNQNLTPPKQSMRSDDVDFQRGELEWGEHNIYFDQYSWKLTYKEVKGPTRND